VAGFLGGPSLTADKLEPHQFAPGLRLEVALAGARLPSSEGSRRTGRYAAE
jgi:hypothetical protein